MASIEAIAALDELHGLPAVGSELFDKAVVAFTQTVNTPVIAAAATTVTT